jgi:hypothetical protein
MADNKYGYKGQLTEEVLLALIGAWRLVPAKAGDHGVSLRQEFFDRELGEMPMMRMATLKSDSRKTAEDEAELVQLERYYKILNAAGYAKDGIIDTGALWEDLKTAGFFYDSGLQWMCGAKIFEVLRNIWTFKYDGKNGQGFLIPQVEKSPEQREREADERFAASERRWKITEKYGYARSLTKDVLLALIEAWPLEGGQRKNLSKEAFEESLALLSRYHCRESYKELCAYPKHDQVKINMQIANPRIIQDRDIDSDVLWADLKHAGLVMSEDGRDILPVSVYNDLVTFRESGAGMVFNETVFVPLAKRKPVEAPPAAVKDRIVSDRAEKNGGGRVQ